MTKSNLIFVCLASTVSIALGNPQPVSPTRGKISFRSGALVTRNQHVFQEDDQSDQNQDQEDQADQSDQDSYDVFYDQLANDGRWYYDDTYGYVFQPAVATDSSDWRPYSDGHWEDTDRGWYWDSNENFGWATYHYGRWVLIDGEGWVWIPGTEWAPSWVSWRDSDDYVGWAPLPPECGVVSVGFSVGGWCDSYWGVGPSWYCFLPYNHWYSHSYVGAFAPFSQNVTIINRTRNVTNIYRNNTVINNFGPQAQQIALRTNRQPTKYNINYVAQRNGFKTAVSGNRLNVIGPKTTLKPVAAKAPTVAKTLTNPQLNKGWKNVSTADATKLKAQFTKQNPVPNNLSATATKGLVKPTILKKPVAGANNVGGNNQTGGNKGVGSNVGGNKGAGNGALPNQSPVNNGPKGSKNLKAFKSTTNTSKKGAQGAGGGNGAQSTGSTQLKSFKATGNNRTTGTGGGSNSSSQKTLKKNTSISGTGNHSTTTYQKPKTTYQQPKASYQQPKASYQQPKASYQQPKASYQPKPAYHPPTTTYKPAPTYHAGGGGGNYRGSSAGGGGNKGANSGGNNNKDKEKKKK
jgi:hypothetical protein